MKFLFISEKLIWRDMGAEVIAKSNLRSLYDISLVFLYSRSVYI